LDAPRTIRRALRLQEIRRSGYPYRHYNADVRIASRVPAGTDILFELGLGSQDVSHECDHPAGGGLPPRLTRSVVEPSGRSSAEIDAPIAARVWQPCANHAFYVAAS
jgi:hypothetical protein